MKGFSWSVKLQTELVYTVEFTANPNMAEELIEELRILIPQTRKEPGCVRYELHRSQENPDVLLFIERFKNQAAFEFHSNTPYVKNFIGNIGPKLVKEMKFGHFQDISEGS